MLLITLLITAISSCSSSDMTSNVFQYDTAFVPAAFGDFNSDEYTDLIVIRNDDNVVEVLLGSETVPLLQHKNLTCRFDNTVTGVVPGDFDGDALLDILVTVNDSQIDDINSVYVLWGNLSSLDCSNIRETKHIKVYGQPLAIDYDKDMIMDLFGEDEDRQRMFWNFKNRTYIAGIPMLIDKDKNRKFQKFREPHSNAFLDMNRDSYADLYITAEDIYEVWTYNGKKFVYDPMQAILLPGSGRPDGEPKIIGQTLFMDFDLEGTIDHLVPVCFNSNCSDSGLYIYSGKWHDLKVSFHDKFNAVWGFVPPNKRKGDYFKNAITLHGGDFNMDGYPDFLVALQKGSEIKTFIFENVECEAEKCDGYKRSFVIRWTMLTPFNEDTVMGVFFDLAQNGVLDILFVRQANKSPIISAFKNNLDFDANFMKVMVVTGKINQKHLVVPTPLGRTRRIFGTSLPGPIIWYKTSTLDGEKRAACAVQLPQSAYFPLQLPYTLFGLGRAPNFIESLDAGIAGQNKSWSQIIPNSQIVVIPYKDYDHWFIQLFVTPSKIIVKTILTISGIFLFISIILFLLLLKERREDHREKLQEAHRFHFDAM